MAALEALSRANQRFGEAFEVGLGFGLRRSAKHLTNHGFMASKLILKIVQGNTIQSIQKHQPGNASKKSDPMASGAGHTNLQPPFRGGAANEAGVKPTKAVGNSTCFPSDSQFFQIELFESYRAYRGFLHGVS